MKRLAWLFMLVLAACDGVGRPLVSERLGGDGTDVGCGMPAPCQSELPELPVPAGPGDFGQLDSCPGLSPASVLETIPNGACSCGTVDVQLGSEPNVTVIGGSYERCRLSISADQPTTVELRRTAFDDAAITLKGPVALQIQGAHVLRLRVRGESTPAGVPTLALNGSDAIQFSLASDDSTFEQLSVSHGTLVDAFIATNRADFASVGIRRSALNTGDFEANDLSITDSTLAIEDGVIAEPTLNQVQMQDCRSVRLVGGDVSKGELGPCSDLLQLYSVRVRDSWLSGPIESDESDIEHISIGSAAGSELLSYSTRLVRVNFCEGAERVRLSRGFVSCADCDGPLTQEQNGLCTQSPHTIDDREQNPCPGFTNPRICEAFPPRGRPR